MHITKWFPLPRQGIAPFVHPSDALWAFESPSPFDVPSHLRASFDEQTSCLHIDFRYLSGEATITEKIQSSHPCVQIEIGKGTGRIRRISINIRELGKDKKKIVAEAQSSLKPSTLSNRLVVGRALERRAPRALDAAFA